MSNSTEILPNSTCVLQLKNIFYMLSLQLTKGKVEGMQNKNNIGKDDMFETLVMDELLDTQGGDQNNIIYCIKNMVFDLLGIGEPQDVK